MFESYLDQRFAETLCDMACFIMRKREQYTVTCTKAESASVIFEEIEEKKSKYVTHIECGDTVTFIFEVQSH